MHQIHRYRLSHVILDLKKNQMLVMCEAAFKEYKEAGKTLEDFEEDYDCSISYDSHGGAINDVCFRNDSSKTAFMLKYNT